MLLYLGVAALHQHNQVEMGKNRFEGWLRSDCEQRKIMLVRDRESGQNLTIY